MIVIRDHAHRPFSSESESGQFKICTTHELQENQRYRFKWRKQKKINFSHCNVNGEIIMIITIIVEMILQRIIFFSSICKRFISKAKCIHKAKSIKFHKRNAFSAIKIENKFTMRKQKSFWFVQRNHLKWNTINVFLWALWFV